MKNITTKLPGDQWSAEDENLGSTGELLSIVNKSGQTPASADLFQLLKGVMRIAGGTVSSTWYEDAGADPSHILSRGGFLSGVQPFLSYEDGLVIEFKSNYLNTGLVLNTINLQGLGDIDIQDTDNGLIIPQDRYTRCVYIGGVFVVTNDESLALKSQIGDVVPNFEVAKQDSLIINRGRFEHLLLNGQSFVLADYPVLALQYPSGDLPDASTGVLRHLETGSTRELGDLEADGIKSHTSTLENFTPTATTDSANWSFQIAKFDDGGAAVHTLSNPSNISFGTNPSLKQSFDDTASILRDLTAINYDQDLDTTIDPINNKIVTYTGETETTMKNIAVQYYVKAKVLF